MALSSANYCDGIHGALVDRGQGSYTLSALSMLCEVFRIEFIYTEEWSMIDGYCMPGYVRNGMESLSCAWTR